MLQKVVTEATALMTDIIGRGSLPRPYDTIMDIVRKNINDFGLRVS